MRIISIVALALILAVALVQPSAAVVIITNWGQSDSPQFATPAAFVDLFFTHQNRKVYHCNTGPFGVCDVDIPPGTIVHWNAWQEDNHLVCSTDPIPVGGSDLQDAAKGAPKASTVDNTPLPNDRPSVVVSVRGKGGRFKHYDVAKQVAEKEEVPSIFKVIPDEAFESADKLFDTLTRAGLADEVAEDYVFLAIFLGAVPPGTSGDVGNADANGDD